MASLARIPHVSVENYLRAGDLQPDMDYVDGVLEERHLGELQHSKLQRFFTVLFALQRTPWQTDAYPELRVQVAPLRFRVTGICVMPLHWVQTPVVSRAPMLCIEILSEDDTLSRQRYRAEDFLRMGVPEVWIVDPVARTAYVLREGTLTQHVAGTLHLEGTPVEVPLADMFAALDE